MENTEIQMSSGIIFELEKCSSFVWVINADADKFMTALKTFFYLIRIQKELILGKNVTASIRIDQS